jgi:hypothetical protein
MHNFLAVDGNGRKDVSILSDPNARELARKFDPMIDKFRDDIGDIRAAITVGARGPRGAVADAVDMLRGELKPGEPAEREARETHGGAPAPKPPTRPQPFDSPLFGPDGAFPELPGYVPKPADGPKFPQRPQASSEESAPHGSETRTAHPLAIERLSPRDLENYEQGLSLGRRLGLPEDRAQNFGMAMAAQINDYGLMPRTDRMVAMQGRGVDGGDRIYASFHPHGDKEPIFNTYLDVNRGANMPMEDSARRMELAQQHHLAQQQNQTLDDHSRGPKLS